MIDQVLALCDEILEMLMEVPDTEAGNNFGLSVEDKVLGIQSFVSRNKRATQGQLDALENMKIAVERWIN
jgi:hypothetical protein